MADSSVGAYHLHHVNVISKTGGHIRTDQMDIIASVGVFAVVQHPGGCVFIDVLKDFFKFLNLGFREVAELKFPVNPRGVCDEGGHVSADAFYLGETLHDVVFPVDIGVDDTDDIVEIFIMFLFLGWFVIFGSRFLFLFLFLLLIWFARWLFLCGYVLSFGSFFSFCVFCFCSFFWLLLFLLVW